MKYLPSHPSRVSRRDLATVLDDLDPATLDANILSPLACAEASPLADPDRAGEDLEGWDEDLARWSEVAA